MKVSIQNIMRQLPSRSLAASGANISYLLSLSIGLSPVPAAIFASVAQAQSIAPANDGVGSIVQQSGNRYDISGGRFSRDGANLFQSFQRFGLNQGEIANFLSNPAVQNILGRVVGGDPSYINGLIQVTGGNANLYLINPAGIVFGANAQLNVPASFTATTANGVGFDCKAAGSGCGGWFNAIGSNDYAALVGTPNTFVFNALQPGAIANLGNLAVNPGKSLTLLGGTVLNTGTLSAPDGQITIVAVPGQNLVRLSQTGSLLNLEFSPPSSLSSPSPLSPPSLPQLLTGGNLGNATGIQVNPDGSIKLSGSTPAIPIQSGTVIASGQISVSPSSSPSSPPPLSPQITLLGDRVALLSANLDASSFGSGGTIRIGGDFQGKGSIPNAQRTFVDANTTIRADGLSSSASSPANGGRVIVWADQATQFSGRITARGGSSGGDGGFVEVSGAQSLSFNGSVDTLAPAGNAGTLLLDPDGITVIAGFTPNPPNAADGIWSSTEDPGPQTIGADSIASILNTTSLDLQANTNIDVNASIVYTGTVRRSLIFQATQTITLAPLVEIRSTVAPLDVTLNADSNAGGAPGAIVMNTESGIFSNGGNIILGGGTDPLTTPTRGTMTAPAGVLLNNATLNSGAGNISIQGSGLVGMSNNPGILIQNNSTIETASGAINLTGTGNGFGFGNNGIQISSSLIRTVSGDIRLTGTGGNGINNNQGIQVETGSIIQTGNGSITLDGTAGSGATGNIGINVTNPSGIQSGNGAIALTGSSIAGNTGIQLEANAINSGNGPITLTADEITLTGTLLNPSVQGTGNIVLQPLTPSQPIAIGGTTDSGAATLDLELTDLGAIRTGFNSFTIGRADGSGAITLQTDLVFRDPVILRSPASQGLIDTSGGSISLENGATLSFVTGGDLKLGSIITGGKPLGLQANGTLTVLGSIITTGGSLSLRGNEINGTALLDSSSETSNGGAISLIANNRIQVGTINSSSAIANGGNVFIDPAGDVQVGYINAQGGAAGIGGAVSIKTQQFFRATDSFIDRNGINASISTTGGLGGSNIIIQHGGGTLNTPFVVGDASRNGTATALTTGNVSLFPTQSFTGSFTTGIQPSQIQLITQNVQSSSPGKPSLPTEIANVLEQPPNKVNPQPSIAYIPPVPLDPIVAPIEIDITQQFVSFLNLPKEPQAQTLVTAQNTLQRIEAATGVKPALIYVRFAADSKNQEQDSDPLELVLVTATGEPVRKIINSATRKQVLEVAKTFRQEASDPRKTTLTSYLPSSQELYQWIIAPLEEAIATRKVNNLVFVLDTGLRAMPVAALNDGKQFLVEKYSIGLMPSLSLTDTRYADLRDVAVLTAGVSRFEDQSLLPAVTIELSAINKDVGSSTRLLDDSFTLSNLKLQRQNQPYSVIHLATHGEFLPGKLSDSYIQFWDTKLRLDQIRQLKWYDPPVEMVVLSACRMAVGDETTELGFAGVAAQAGAKSVVASLWYVSDEGTAGLMAEFYHWLRISPIRAEALRQAQIAMLRGKVHLQGGKLFWSDGQRSLPNNLVGIGVVDEPLSHPYYWASFTMIGSPW